MPGISYHLGFADLVSKSFSETKWFDKNDFFAGNLIPDLAKDKTNSHYRKSASVDGFVVPELTAAKKELIVRGNSIKLGIYSHLYLDYHFIEGFLIPDPRNNMCWNVSEFFSHDGVLYGAYTEINHLMIRDNRVPFDTIERIPNHLPITGLSIFDERREKSWKDDFEGYMGQKKEYTGDVFDYERLWKYIEDVARQFVEEHYEYVS